MTINKRGERERKGSIALKARAIMFKQLQYGMSVTIIF